MLAPILFVCYFVLLCLVLVYWKRLRRTQLSPGLLVGAFAFKVAFGCLYGYLFLKYYGGDDTWLLHQQSLIEYQKILHHPGNFLADFLPYSAFAHADGALQGFRFWFYDLENFSFWKLLGIFDLFSAGNYYVNVLLFNFVVFAGPLMLFRICTELFSTQRTVLILCIFFSPACIFWLSGIRAEALLLLFLALMLRYAEKMCRQFSFRAFLVFAFALAGMIIYRLEFAITLLPALIAWIWCDRAHARHPISYFVIAYGVCGLIFFISPSFSSAGGFPAFIAERQRQFLMLDGSRLPLDTLEPTVSGYLSVLPQAIANGFLRPFPWQAVGTLQLLNALNAMLFIVLVLLAMIFRVPAEYMTRRKSFFWLCIFYGCIQVILIGYTVPFPGAIARYVAIPMQLLLIATACSINWQKIFSVRLK